VQLEVEAFGDAAVRVALPPDSDRARLLAALRDTKGVIDAVVAERYAVVTFAPGCPPRGLAEIAGAALASEATPASARTAHVIAVEYDGVDLDAIAARVGLSAPEVIELHAAPTYEVVAVGFLPGFAYLRGLDPRLSVPRHASPRARVPARAVAIAGPYTGIYPFASPGGWNLVGTAASFSPFDERHGAKLAVGDTVRFARSRP
jgi:UPF0271 protein